jgi:hypothetical protein
MPVRTQNVTQQMLIKPIPCRRGHNMYLKLCKPNLPMPGRTQIVCQLVFTIHIPWTPGHNMYLNMCWSNPSVASENTNCISFWVDQIPSYGSRDTKWISKCTDKTHPMPVRTQNVSQHVLNNDSDDRKCISTRFDQNSPMLARTQNLSQPIPCQRGLTMFLNMWWTNITYANEDTKCISTWVDQISYISAREKKLF